MRFFVLLISTLLVLSCSENKENDTYEIYNTILKDQVSTYGILLSYYDFSQKLSEKEEIGRSKRIEDSLIKSKSLTYYLSPKLSILDTLNPSDEFRVSKEEQLIVEFRPNYSTKNIDFSKLRQLEIGKRIDKSLPIDDNQPHRTFLGDYDLSEPIFYAQNKAVIRLQHNCGSKCGVGILIYLVKNKSSWKITEIKDIWIS
ncbi:hypothetical protein SAMN05660477_01720 [Soonwooa buanensis]|uniref:Lipoprotein n=1 Tax=Soonwooa buanensis TaxID=619805 RepID=A0A1T5F1Z8_9FLAO|nr:hypothetical protein [Soonwooa buanensis]SKB90193.1 hypothetical protein SAMN05660477_01720 [Soonwooa buanensis]